MKLKSFFKVLTGYSILFMLACCSKPSSPNTAPIANAGEDVKITAPSTHASLSGSSSDNESNIIRQEWKLISGSYSPVQVVHPFSPVTIVQSLLLPGRYTFEFTVTDSYDLQSKDTAQIIVEDLNIPVSGREIILYDLVWSCPWECQLSIDNLYNYIPQNNPFKVYIKTDDSPYWIPVYDASRNGIPYYYYIDNLTGSMGIFSTTGLVGGTPDIKLVY